MRERKEETSTDNTHGSFWEASTGSKQARNKKNSTKKPNSSKRAQSEGSKQEGKGRKQGKYHFIRVRQRLTDFLRFPVIRWVQAFSFFWFCSLSSQQLFQAKILDIDTWHDGNPRMIMLQRTHLTLTKRRDSSMSSAFNQVCLFLMQKRDNTPETYQDILRSF